jgi:hypothetical protein
MKIKLSEQQLRKLVENKISYLPEKIDEFVQQAMKVLENVQQTRNKHYNNIVTLTISEVMQEKSSYQKMALAIADEHTKFNEQHTKYFNIVDMYDFMDMPNNVKQLEKINDKIEKYSEDIYYIGNALEEIINAVDYIGRTED